MYAGNDGGVLEGEENPCTCTLKHAQLFKRLALVVDSTLSDFVGRVTHNDTCKRRLSCSVSPHNDVDFSTLNDQIHAIENWRTFHAYMEVFNP